MSVHTEAGPAAKDPVCGMTVRIRPEAITDDYEGTRFYFCCPRCRERFRSEPAKYLGARRNGEAHLAAAQPSPQMAAARPQALGYTCPMHPEVKQSTPAACPLCGMAVEPIGIELPQQTTEYFCPMHPEVVRDQPGACPICGMALEPRDKRARAA